MHTDATFSCSKPLCRTRLAEVNPLWHFRACKLGFNQFFSLLHHAPAKWGKIQQSGKGIMLGLFQTARKGMDQVTVPSDPNRVHGHVRWDIKGTIPLCCPCSWD